LERRALLGIEKLSHTEPSNARRSVCAANYTTTEHRETIRQLDDRVRNTEEAIKLLAQEQRHAREMDSSEREKLLLRLQNELAKSKELPPARGRKNR
jgi:hypothetical protein